MTIQDIATLDGDLAQVTGVDDAEGKVYVRYQDGRSAIVTGMSVFPTRGDILFLEYNRCHFAPPETWIDPSRVGVVRLIRDDRTMVVETTQGMEIVSIGPDDVYERNQTVEFNAIRGALRVVSETPIERLRDEISDRDEPAPPTTAAPEPLTFEDFGGFREVVAQARELIESQFKYRKHLDRIGTRPLRGILFTGPPGVGKTHLARIIAQETDAAFYPIDGPSLVSKWVGSSERALRDLFDRAQASPNGRAIIFFDEIDTIAERRTDTHEWSRKFVGQLLTLMDGFRRDGAVIVIAATNRLEALDPALLRPGRFDRVIAFGAPSESDRCDILRVGARRKRTADDLPYNELAVLTEGWSAADLDLIWTEAGQVASRDERGRISAEDMMIGYERVLRRLAPRKETRT
ncbi:ATP-binding protein [Brevundimonas bacteroides]|uniref:ATP-binding protein n=1 Tax=Brevundimonas bacteroides TaxID=74311 RepID=UPI000495CB6E|nr:AAA family ATPase [Brevundimonas bacteroides]